jgi:hypothetical protein
VTRSGGQAKIISESDLETALVECRRSGERLASVLIRMNLATERPIAKALAYQLGFSYVDLADHPPDRAAVPLISKEVALKRNCIAIAVGKNVLTVAMSDLLLLTLVQDIEFQTGHRIKQVVATREEIVNAINRWHPGKALVPRERHSHRADRVWHERSAAESRTAAVPSRGEPGIRRMRETADSRVRRHVCAAEVGLPEPHASTAVAGAGG